MWISITYNDYLSMLFRFHQVMDFPFFVVKVIPHTSKAVLLTWFADSDMLHITTTLPD